MYDFNQHKHNFSVWTVARAVQRGFSTTSLIKKAIEASDLREYAENDSSDESDFKNFHSECAKQLIDFLENNLNREVTYGRASKIISVYLKTSVIMFNKGECIKSKFIHPPIDRILLNRIADEEKLKEKS